MMNLKYKSVPFGKMNDHELGVAAYAMLMKIQVITGWTVPDEPMDDILVDQLRMKLRERYALVNPEEMEYAFRNDTSVKDWGKAINLSLMDEVLLPYLEKRKELSRLEEQKAPLMIEHKEDLSDKAMQDWLDSVTAEVKSGKAGVELMPVMLYDWLVRKEVLKHTAAEKWEYMQNAVEYRQVQIAEQCESDPESYKTMNAFLNMKEKGEFTGKEVEILKNLARRMILYTYLKKQHGK